jgi:hypothetical protein
MIQRGDSVRFAFKAFAKVLGRNFDGNASPETWIVRFVDFAHAAGSDRREDFLRKYIPPSAG